MNGYLAILKGRLACLFQYRAAALAGFATQVFWCVVKVMILTAFYAQSAALQPISLAQAITFIWLGQALLPLLPWNIDKEIEAQVKNGNVAYEQIRPLDLYWLWFFSFPCHASDSYFIAQHSFIFIGRAILWPCDADQLDCRSCFWSLSDIFCLAIICHYNFGHHQSILDDIWRRDPTSSAPLHDASFGNGCAFAIVSRLDAAFFEHSAHSRHSRHS